MRCEDIQKHLAIDPRLSCLPAEARAHVLECHACRQAQALFTMIDRELREQPVWHPPAGFAEPVAFLGMDSLRRKPARPKGLLQYIFGLVFEHPLQPILLGLLAAAFCLLVLVNVENFTNGYPALVTAFSKAILANAVQLAWFTSVLSLGFTAWITQRALR